MKRVPAKAATGLYVYVIGLNRALQAALSLPNPPAGLEPDAPLSLVSAGTLAAIVSRVPLVRYGEGRFEQQLKDPVWAADKVMRHQSVAAFFSERQPVVPLRFGVIYSDPKKIQEMLLERADSLMVALARVEGCEEWALNLLADRSVLAEKITGISPKLSDMRRRARSSSQGQAYLLQKQAERMRTAEMKSHLKRVADDMASLLGDAAKAIKRLPPAEHEGKQKPSLAAKFVYLVPRKNVADFKKEAEKLAQRHGAHGFRIELTGPWPPYNFIE
jgi:hypothetical protein